MSPQPSLQNVGDPSRSKTTIASAEQRIKYAQDAYQAGDYKHSLSIWLALLAEWESNPRGDNQPGIAMRNIGVIYRSLGDFLQAERYLTSSVESLSKSYGEDHQETATALSNLGLTQDFLGQYELAISALEKALRIRETRLGAEHPYTATTLDALARVHRSIGRYARSEDLYLKSLSIRLKSLGGSHPSTAAAYSNLAQLYVEQGLFAKALSQYANSERIYAKASMKRHSDWGTVAGSVGFLYLQIGDLDLASKYLRESIDILTQASSADSAFVGISLSNLALTEKRKGNLKGALDASQSATKIALTRYGETHRNTAASLNNEASLSLLLGDYQQAISSYSKAFRIYEAALGSQHKDTLIVGNNLAIGLTLRGRSLEAYRLSKNLIGRSSRLIQATAALLQGSSRQSFADTLPNVFEISFSSASQNIDGAELALFSRLNRQGLLEEIEKRQAQLAVLPGEQQEVALRLRAVTQQLSSLSLSSEERKGLREKQEGLERELYRLLPELKPRVVEVSDVAAVLPEGGALVEFQRYEPYDGRKKQGERWGEARYLALVLTEDGSIAAVDLGLAEGIEKKVEQALVASEQKFADAEALWGEVSELVMQPLANALQGTQILVISPDGELNRLPFAAMPAPGGGGLLAERYQLRLVTTGRELLDLKDPVVRKGEKPLVVANPDYDLVLGGGRRTGVVLGDVASRSVQQEEETGSVFAERGQQRSAETTQLVWGRLPGTKKEGEFVAGLIDGRLLVEKEARAEVVQQAKAPVVLHIASHAFFLADQEEESREALVDGAMRAGLQGDQGLKASRLSGESPLLRSGIALAGANRVSQRREGEEAMTVI